MPNTDDRHEIPRHEMAIRTEEFAPPEDSPVQKALAQMGARKAPVTPDPTPRNKLRGAMLDRK